MSSLQVIIKPIGGIKYQGEVAAVSASNEVGLFDILPEHAHFVTSITGEIVVHEVGGTSKSFVLTSALLHVKDDVVSVLGKE